MNLPDPEHSPLLRALLVLGYLVAAACWGRHGARTDPNRRWWLLGAFLLFLLAMNKAFDFRTQCETFIRTLAQANGWYQQRQPVQFLLAILLPLAAGLFLLLLLLRTKARRFASEHPLMLPGWFLLLLYLALRQSQEWKPALHWLTLLHYHQWRLLLEVIGLVLVTRAAIRSGNPFSTLDR